MLRQNEWHGVYLFIHCHFVSVIVFVRFSFDLLRFNVFCFSYLASLISNTVEVIKIKFCLSSIRKRIMHFSFFFFAEQMANTFTLALCLHLRTPISFTSHNRKKMNTLNSTVDLWKGF